MTWKDTLKHTFVEEDDATATPAQPTPPTSQPVYNPNQSWGNPNGGATTPAIAPVTDSNAAYQALLDKTKFENTRVGKIMSKYLKSLEATFGPGQMSFKAALAMAKDNDNISAQDVLAAYDEMKQNLENERAGFTNNAQRFQDAEIAPREKAIADANATINTLTPELAAARSKMQNGQATFTMAATQRDNEINRERTEKQRFLT